MRGVPTSFCPCTRLKGQCQRLLGWDVESDSGRCPIGLEGGRSFALAKVLDHYQTLTWSVRWLGPRRDAPLCQGHVQEN